MKTIQKLFIHFGFIAFVIMFMFIAVSTDETYTEHAQDTAALSRVHQTASQR